MPSAELYRDLHVIAATLIFVLLTLQLKMLRQHSFARWNSAFMFCVLAYALRVLTDEYAVWRSVFNAFEYLAPVFFVSCIRVNFQDGRAFGKIEIVSFTALVALLLVTKFLAIQYGDDVESRGPFLSSNSWYAKLIWMQFFVSTVCVIAAFWVALQDWNSDLVAKRRISRAVFVFAGCPTILMIITLHIMSIIWFDRQELFSAGIASLLILVFFGLIVATLRVDEELYLQKTNEQQLVPTPSLTAGKTKSVIESIKAETGLSVTYKDELAKLEAQMQEAEAYREMGLTLDQLSAMIGVPEYRLRNAINQGLGFRNFNVYLNTYRIAAAIESLREPGSDKAVLEISIESGFRSLSTFNKAFKEETGKTPTEFRKAVQLFLSV